MTRSKRAVIVAALLALVLAPLAGCRAWPPSSPEGTVEVSHVVCRKDFRVSTGTVTVAGRTVVTANHVAEGCPGYEGTVAPGINHDLAIISAVLPASCKDAAVGEAVIYRGYPGTDSFGDPYDYNRPTPVEEDFGFVEATNRSVTVFNGKPLSPALIRMDGLSSATMTRVRPGYSGGAVISAKDGRLVGIINSVSLTDKRAYFTPVSFICAKIKEINNE